MPDIAALVTPPLLLDSTGAPANGDIYTRVTSSIEVSGGLVTPTQGHGIITSGQFKSLDGTAFHLPVTPEFVAVEVFVELREERPEGRKKHSIRRTVSVPDQATVTWLELVDVVPVDSGGDYAVPAWVTALLLEAVAAGDVAITARDEALGAQVAAEAAAASVPTEAELSATIAAAVVPKLDATAAAITYAPAIAGFRGNGVGAVGDSIPAEDGSAPSAGAPGGAFHTRAAAASKGRMKWLGASSVGGNTVAQIVDERIPAFIAAFPTAAACFVHAGTNSMSAIALLAVAARPAALDALLVKLNTGYDALVAARIQPIAMTIPHRTGGGATEINKVGDAWNRLLLNNAARRGFLFVDSHKLLLDPTTGAWKALYNKGSDGIHPSLLAHKIIGEYAAEQLSSHFPPRTIRLTDYVGEDTDLLTGSGMFATDVVTAGANQTPGDGISDGWQSYSGTGITFTREQDADGIWWQVISVPTAASGSATLQAAKSGFAAGNKLDRNLLQGDRIRVSGRMKLSGLDTSLADTQGQSYFNVQIMGASNAVLASNGSPMLRSDITGEIIWEAEAVVPAGFTGSWRVNLQVGKPIAGTVVAKFAQVSVQNLTAFGIA